VLLYCFTALLLYCFTALLLYCFTAAVPPALVFPSESFSEKKGFLGPRDALREKKQHATSLAVVDDI
jgi:hypothetical protein